MAGRFVLLAALCPLALAFSDTLPIVAWSSHSSSILDLLPSTLSNSVHSASLLESILFNDDVCDHDAIVLVDQPGLHASDLRTLSPSSNLAKAISSAPSARQFPYVPNNSPVDLNSIAQSLSARCNSRLANFAPGQAGIFLEKGSKHVMCINMPHLRSVDRKSAMVEHESRLSSELSTLTSTFPKYVIVYTGSSRSPAVFKRQTPDIVPPSRPVLELSNFSNANTTLPEGGILKRYQLLTPGLITVLLVTVFLLVPIVMTGINALASIQSPLRVEAPKGYNALERKTQ